MPFGTHRQRVPAMLAVACAGMLVYAVAGAAPDDGRQLAPATCSSSEAGPPTPGCVEAAADKGSTPTTAKGSTPTKCEPTTTTTGKGGDKDPTTTTTGKGGDKDPTTTTTGKSGDKDPTTTTTEKGGDKGSTTTTGKNDSGDKDATAAKAGQPTTALAVKSDAETAAAKDSGDDNASKAATDPDKDCPTTTTTEKGGKGDSGGKDTTTTTRKGGGKGSTTTTTEKDGKGSDKPTTSTTTQGGTVDPQTPGDSGGSADPGSSDPGDTPISPQEAPPYDAPDSDPGPAADPEAAADPGPVDDGFDMWDDEEVAISPMEAPGSGSMMPVINDFMPSSGEKSSGRRERSRPTGSSPSVQELAAAPVVTLRGVAPTPGSTESAAVSRRLGGLQTSVTESAFPANIISTPGEFPINHRDPLAAAALVVLVGVSRELFKVWRRRATDFWPA